MPILRQMTTLASNPSTNATISNEAASVVQLNDDGPFMDVFNQEGPVDGLLDREYHQYLFNHVIHFSSIGNQILGIFVSQSSLSFHFLVQVLYVRIRDLNVRTNVDVRKLPAKLLMLMDEKH